MKNNVNAAFYYLSDGYQTSGKSLMGRYDSLDKSNGDMLEIIKKSIKIFWENKLILIGTGIVIGLLRFLGEKIYIQDFFYRVMLMGFTAWLVPTFINARLEGKKVFKPWKMQKGFIKILLLGFVGITLGELF